MNAWEKYKQEREKSKQEEAAQFSGFSAWENYKANREERLAQVKKEREEQKARESRLEELRAKYGIKDRTGGAIPRPTDPELTPRLAALRAKYGIATQSKTDDDTSSRIAALREKYGLTQKAKETSLSYEELAGMTLQERLQRAALGMQEAVTKGAGNLLDALAAIGKSGDPTLPMNNATVAINAIRDNPEGVQQAMDNRAEIEAKQQAQVERAKQWASENKAGATAASVVSSPLSMVDYLQQLVEINAVGHSLPSTGLKPGEITQTLREGVSKDMGNAGKFLYNTAMSGVDSLVAGALSGGMSGVGALILGGGAASSAMNDIKQRGGTDQQAVLGGAAAGAFEAIFEKLSLGQLNALKEMPVVGAKTVVANIAKSVFTNASEEAATELANGLFDAYLMQDLSNYDLTTQEGRRDLAKQVGLSALAGGLMGGVFGGIGSVGGYLTNSQVERMIRNETTMQEMGIDTTGKTMSQLRAEVRARMAAQEQGAETSSEESGAQTPAQETASTTNPAVAEETQAEQVVNTRTEGITNGEEVYLRNGSQRAGSANPGGQVSAVEESTGRSESGQAERQLADRGAASLTYGERVSTNSLGIGGGSIKNNIRLLKSGDTQHTAEAKRIAKERGLRVYFFADDNLSIRQNGGGFASARGYISGDRVFIRVDHPLYTADQIMRHEAGHDMITKGEVDLGEVRKRVKKAAGGREVRRIAKMYAEAYAGSGMTAEELWEEVVCDSLGDMNIFSGKIEENEAGVYLTHTKEATQADVVERRQERGPPDGKTSIETLPDGKKYVRADRQVIFGNDPESWSEQLEDYINGKIRKGQNVQLVAEDGDVLTLTANTAGKVASMYNGDGTTMSEEAFERKVNAGAHIDEIASVSVRGKKTKTDKGDRHGDMATGGWNYRTAFFQDFDKRYYRLKISVAIGADGNAVYNIGDISERSFPKIDGSSAKGGAQNRKASYEVSMAQTEREVKRKFSRELDNAYLSAVERGDMEAAQRMVDEAAKAAGYTVKAYHGTDAESFNVFDRGKIGTAFGLSILGDGFYFAEKRKTAEQYGKNVFAVYLKQNKPYQATSDDSYKLNAAKLETDGYDGVALPAGKGTIYMVLDSEQIKSAEPVTYDDDRNVIPLSERFNPDKVDIRYSMEPTSEFKPKRKVNAAEFSETTKQAVKDAQLAGMMNQGRKDAEKLRKAKETTAEVRRKRDDTIRNLKEHQREQKQKASESRNASAIRGKIQRHVGDLSRKLKTPTDKKHIPENMRTAVAKLLEAINMESNYELEYGKDAKYHRAGVGTPGAEPTKRSKAFRELRLFYEKIVNGEDQTPMVVDPDLLANLNELEGLHDVRIADMSTEQLQLVWDTIRAIEMSITNVDKLFRADRYKHVSEVAQEIRDAAAHRKSKRPVRFRWGNRMLTQDMLDSLTWLHQLGEGGDTVYHILQGARDQKIAILAEVGRLTHDAIGDINVHKLEEKIHDFELSSGEHVSMTTAQIMSLYELNKRKKAQDHIYKGGIRPEPVKTGALGKEVSTPENVQVTETDVAKIVSALTAEQVRVADALQTIMQGYLADIGNEASMEVYGYKKFNEENYFPISSDPHQVQDKIGDVLEGGHRRPKSVAEWGSAKATVRNANNGLMIGSIFDVFAQHAVDMSTYASHLAALEDVNRIRHFKWRDKDGTLQATMGGIIERLTGDKNQAYLNKLLQDISAGVAKNGVSGFGRLTANYKAASVGLNLRVAIQQPTSIVRAATVIDSKYLAIGTTRRGGWKKALKWAPIAQWKDWGNFEINQGRSAKDIFFDTDTALERVRDKSMWLAGKMDSITWGAIWNACEAELRDTNKDLENGSDEFYKAVAQRFTDVIDQTQVVDNVLGRSQIMRSGDELAKMATSFLGEPTRTYNLLYRTAQDYFGEQDISRKKTAKKQLGRAVVAYTVSTFALALAQSVVDAWRDDEDRERKYLERYVDNVLPNFVSNIDLFSAIPYIKDVISILQGYEISRMDMDALTSLIQAGQNLDKTLKGEGRSSVAGAMVRLLAEAARIFGISVANLKRDMLGITQSFLVETGNWELQYELEKAMNNITVAGSRSEIYKILMSALSDGDYDAYKSIVADMVNEGVKASTIEQGVRSAIAKYTEKHKGFSIPKEAKALLGISTAFPESTKKNDTFGPEDLGGEAYVRYSEMKADDYSAIESELRKSTRFNQLSNADKNRALDYAEKIAKEFALESASAGRYTVTTKWISKADDAQRIGISTGEYILFHMAYNDASGENKREIVHDWLERNSALSDSQRDFLWGTVYDSEF